MTASDPHNQHFLAPQSRYYGHFSAVNLAFNAQLQEFTRRVNILCDLETGGKITPQEAFEDIKQLWQQLSDRYQALGLSERADD
ncbi:DUF7219 family protein [Leptolyngbya iicbica]|uniref:Isopropylmalate/homocitrate/citramalate synthase n=2 Tax=Cyanophyceae TaxID=3028117 RepID=A0A4Q7EGG6_9CYAN|nr:hypothetical protein [Leptolyngbya sp. LK]RZM82058.1 hypothetical protein DYY88_01980 [Leptolyngbya sp. LK]